MNSLLDEVRAAVQKGQTIAPGVRAALAREDDPGVLRRVGRLLEGHEMDDGALRPTRMSVLATCTAGALPSLLRPALVGVGLSPSLQVADYGTFELSLAGGVGDPDLVACLLDDAYFLPTDWSGHDVAGLITALRDRLTDLRGLIAAATEGSTATLVLHTVPLPTQLLDTVLSWRDRAALARAWHQLNADLLGLAQDHPQVAVIDLASLLAAAHVETRDDRLYRYADLPYTDGALLVYARQVARVAQARMGASRKVLALDLDNTLWGGVLGEVGVAGVQLGGLYPGNCYQQLQLTVRRLREQGVILTLLSKNDAELVDEALRDHPAMVLRCDAFAYRAVNWTAKAQNLRAAAESLDLAPSAFVFMDDSPFELEAVAHELPEVAQVPADGDPAHLVAALLRPGHFDVMTLTTTDLARPRLYQERAARHDFSTGFGSTEAYLAALGLELTAVPIGEFEVARVAQLAARTNQFNLTGRRFSEAETWAMSGDPSSLVASFSVADRFGDEGIVGAAWVHIDSPEWTVSNLVLSCRVLSRGVELAVVGWLCAQARSAGARTLRGRFVPTGRNGVAADLWTRAGLTPDGPDGEYTLDLSAGTDPTPNWIKVCERSVI
jgi:FkbH-like protein